MKNINLYPICWKDFRSLKNSYRGDVYIWDIDQTYLQTLFFTFWDIVKIPFERAIDKRAHFGMPEILRGLRRGNGPKYASTPLYFISASPNFLRPVLEQKMLLDGVEQDGVILKDFYRLFFQFRPSAFFYQLDYKLAALMNLRLHHPLANESLFGDNVEHDALAYSLYSRFIAEEYNSSHWEKKFKKYRLRKEMVFWLLSLREKLPEKRGGVEAIYIYQSQKKQIEEIEKGPHQFFAFSHPLQLACILHHKKKLDWETLHQLILLLVKKQDYVKKIKSIFKDMRVQKHLSAVQIKTYENRVFKSLKNNYNRKE